MNSRNIKNYSNFKIFKVMKSMSKTRYSHFLFSSAFNDKFSRFHLDVSYISMRDASMNPQEAGSTAAINSSATLRHCQTAVYLQITMMSP